MVFWEIASCQVPYEGYDADTIKDSVKSGERLDIPTHCPSEFKELIELCWHQEPKQRPTASNVFDKISQIIEQNSHIYEVPKPPGNIPDLNESTRIVSQQILIGSEPNRHITKNLFEPQIETKKRQIGEQVFNNQDINEVNNSDLLSNEIVDNLFSRENTIYVKQNMVEYDNIHIAGEEVNFGITKIGDKGISIKENTSSPFFPGIIETYSKNILELSKEGNKSGIEAQIKDGADVNYEDLLSSDWHVKGSTPLHYSSQYGHDNLVTYLAKKGANINHLDSHILLVFFLELLFM